MRIVIAGDFVPNLRVAKCISEGVNFVDDRIINLVTCADYSILNLESPIVYSPKAAPIEKAGPNLCCSKDTADCIKRMGFNCVTLANNHFMDYGEAGVIDTLEACRGINLDIVGGGIDGEESSQTLYQRIGDKTLAIINCCEHEFSIASTATAGSNPLDPIRQYYSIKEAKQKADFVIVIVHGGHETCQLPSVRMQDTYRFFIDIGADAVVNHHQHCHSGYEVYNNKPIFYGLGNFCFDSFSKLYGDNWNYGFLLSLNLCDDSIRFELYPYSQCLDSPMVKLIDERENFEKHIAELNETINDSQNLKSKLAEFYSLSLNSVDNLLEARRGRSFTRFFLKGKMPKFLLNRRRICQLINIIECESHRDRILYVLKKILNDN